MRIRYKVVIPVHYYGGDPCTMHLPPRVVMFFDNYDDARELKERCDKLDELLSKDEVNLSDETARTKYIDMLNDKIGIQGWGFIIGVSKIYSVEERLID